MNERAAAILAKARKTLELAKVEREDVLADLVRRELNDRTIPTLPIDRGQLIYKRHDDAKVTTRMTPVTETSTPATVTEQWQQYIAAQIDADIGFFAEAVAEQLIERDKRIKGLESEIESLRDVVAASRVKPRKPKQLAVTVPGPFLRLHGPSNAA